MSEIFIILILIAGYLVIYRVFIYSAKLLGKAKNKKTESEQNVEEKHVIDTKENFIEFKSLFILPILIWILIAAIFVTVSEGPHKNGFIQFAHLLFQYLRFGIWIFAAFMFSNTLLSFYLNARLHKKQLLIKMYKTYRVRRSCSSSNMHFGLTKVLLILAPMSSLVSFFFLTDLILPASVVIWSIIFYDAKVLFTPPVILLLGKSRDQILILQNLISQTASGATAISLIRAGTPANGKWATAAADDLIRALPDEDWESIVHHLTKIVELIILDAREITSNVEIELEILNHPSLASRTLIIQNNSKAGNNETNKYGELIRAGAKSITTKEIGKEVRTALGTKFLN